MKSQTPTAYPSAPAHQGSRRLKRESSADQVAAHIRRLIMSGELRKDAHLRQDEIAEELGVSRIPVREAIIALDRQGWLRFESNRGAYVAGLEMEDIRDHYELRGLVFGLVARRDARLSKQAGARSSRRSRSVRRMARMLPCWRCCASRVTPSCPPSRRPVSSPIRILDPMAGPFAKAARNAMRDGETSADAVARFVRRLIFEGALTPGQRLPQDDIAEAVGVSRIPVREAIIALEREGWLQVERHRGAFVTVFDDQAVLDRFALHGRFYGFAARRALARMSGDELASLGVLAAGLARRSSAAAFDRANTLYISTLVNLSGSNRLRAILRSTAQIVPGKLLLHRAEQHRHPARGDHCTAGCSGPRRRCTR